MKKEPFFLAVGISLKYRHTKQPEVEDVSPAIISVSLCVVVGAMLCFDAYNKLIRGALQAVCATLGVER